MKKVVINIGLKVGNEEPKQQLSRTLTSLLGFFALTSVRTEDEGVYKGNKERTLVAYFETNQEETLNKTLEYICSDLHQEAIAYKIDGVGGVAFNPRYEGEHFAFDQKYFKD
jgi:hypothetical protein